ncbi:hypothetical protein BGZ76_010979 [Entomortierella beljakovae]|nr:hypothetical protein BGZ76_010979 [Entomortierella beljakovae]
MPPKKKAAARKSKATIAAAKETPKVDDTPIADDTKDNAETAEESKGETIEETVKVKRTRKVTKTKTTTTLITPDEASNEEHLKIDPQEDNTLKKQTESEVKTDNEKGSVNQDQDQEMHDSEATETKEKAPSVKSTMAERMEKLKGLRQKLNASKQENRTALMTEHQKSKVNKKEEFKKERAREDAEKLMAKQEADEAGEDYERSQFWGYSVESVERWNEKQDAKKFRMDNKFTDWDQVNHKKYLKQVGELKPNLAAYNSKKEAAMYTNENGELVVSTDSGFYRDANSVAFLSDDKPDTLAVDRMAADVTKQIDARTRFSKRRAHRDDDDVNYINDANKRFNQKISRFYDKHTKEIRDDFERGTAL